MFITFAEIELWPHIIGGVVSAAFVVTIGLACWWGVRENAKQQAYYRANVDRHREHAERTEEHMDRVEKLLERIVVALEKRSGE